MKLTVLERPGWCPWLLGLKFEQEADTVRRNRDLRAYKGTDFQAVLSAHIASRLPPNARQAFFMLFATFSALKPEYHDIILHFSQCNPCRFWL